MSWLREAGHDVFVLTMGPTSVLAAEAGCLFRCTGRLSVNGVVKLLKRHDIQLVHCHLDTYWLAAWAGFLAGIPSVRTVHGSLSRPGMLAPREFMKSWVSYHFLQQNVVAVNDDVGQEVARHFRMRLGDGLFVIPNGCRVRPTHGVADISSSVNFAFVGRLEVAKGFDVLLKAFRDVRENCKGVRLVVIGDGPLRQQIPADLIRAGDIWLSSRWLDRQEVHERLVCADVLVLPSKSEGTPMVVLEAMTLGVPAVVSTHANHSLLVNHSFNGLVFDGASKDDLVTALTWCVQYRARLIEMGNRATETAREWNRRCADEYTTLLTRLARS